MLITHAFIKKYPEIWERIKELEKRRVVRIVKDKKKRGYVVIRNGLNYLPTPMLEELLQHPYISEEMRLTIQRILGFRKLYREAFRKIMSRTDIPKEKRFEMIKKAVEDYKKQFIVEGVDIIKLQKLINANSFFESIRHKLPPLPRKETQHEDEVSRKIRPLLQLLYD